MSPALAAWGAGAGAISPAVSSEGASPGAGAAALQGQNPYQPFENDRLDWLSADKEAAAPAISRMGGTKPSLILFIGNGDKDHCCARAFERAVFKDQTVVGIAKEHFITVRLDRDGDVAKKFEIKRPSLVILDTEGDREQMRRAFRTTRKIYNTAPMADLIVSERTPGAQVESDDELDAFIRATTYVAQHPTSTCTMGTGKNAVVDSELRVVGVEGLRIADCSVMPTVPGGNTNLPVIMLAEKAADLIDSAAATLEKAR